MLAASPKVFLEIQTCVDLGGCPTDFNTEIENGKSKCNMLGTMCGAYIEDTFLSDDEVMDVIAEEVVHTAAAAAAGPKVKTGVECSPGEDGEECTDAWLKKIREERKRKQEQKPPEKKE